MATGSLAGKVCSSAASSRRSTCSSSKSAGSVGVSMLAADHFERDLHVAARGVGVRADLFMRLAYQRLELGLRKAVVLDAHLHRQPEAAAVARADRDGAGDPRLRRIALLLLRDEV